MGRTVINETENKQTVILNDSPEGVEGGYFDSLMEWHEFGGGGGSVDITPVLSITVVNSTAEGYSVNPKDDSLLVKENNNLVYTGGVALSVDNGETKVFETYIPKKFEVFGFELETFYHPEGVMYAVSNLVNCSVINNKFLDVTDPTQNASCTLTFSLGE